MREPGAARSAREAGRFAQQGTVEIMDVNATGQMLHQYLNQHGRVEIEGWSINPDGAEIWLTNPYGIDVGFYDNDAEGCARILERISTDDHEREWGTL
ncbi:hypothetical protein N5D77_24505 [Comamonas thiooxydans]|nr:hypothetical protein [Comamonas thiooxydans]MDH1789731.1 hypothetical protein [Comamonas thiooxydans]